MKNVTRYSIRILGINLAVLIVLGFVATYFGDRNGGFVIMASIFYFVSIIVQMFVGLGLILNEEKRDWGKAMLISMGIILLIGFSVCSVAIGLFK